MKEVFTTSQYRRDIKKYANDKRKLQALYAVIDKLRRGITLSPTNRQHFLHGEYEGCLECHIGGDFLLIWIEENSITLVRVGTHSSLFGH
ncbi:MAG: type II toxin-antitoxin system YafQ family toxin [Bacteroidaceae bacterium]|nr:type II toxin-antitoxin system YafQ family toxin [Bacteroidaceae bacterium]